MALAIIRSQDNTQRYDDPQYLDEEIKVHRGEITCLKPSSGSEISVKRADFKTFASP